MHIPYCLLLFFLYTTTQAMERQLQPWGQPEAWERQEFWDLADDDDRHNENIAIQRYLNQSPLLCPISRRNCLFLGFWSGVFVPSIISSQQVLANYFASISPQTYVIGAGIATVWSLYEIKKLMELLAHYNNAHEDDLFQEFN